VRSGQASRSCAERCGEQVNPGPGSPPGLRREAWTVLRKSVLSKVVFSSILPVRYPCPTA